MASPSPLQGTSPARKTTTLLQSRRTLTVLFVQWCGSGRRRPPTWAMSPSASTSFLTSLSTLRPMRYNLMPLQTGSTTRMLKRPSVKLTNLREQIPLAIMPSLGLCSFSGLFLQLSLHLHSSLYAQKTGYSYTCIYF